MIDWVQKQELQPFALQRVALLFLMGTLSLGLMGKGIHYDLILVVLLGFFLSSKGGLRGWGYACGCLGLVSIFNHLQLEGAHVWQLGLEVSIGFSLLLVALGEEQGKGFVSTLEGRLGIREQTIRDLEAEAVKFQGELAQSQLETSEKLAELRLCLDESEQELSSIQILNEVLRKNMAQVGLEKEVLAETHLQTSRKMGQLLQEIDLLQKELHRLSSESRLAEQNRHLFKELNEVRVKEAEVHLAHETALRLYAQEKRRAEEGQGRVDLAERQIEQMAQELEALQKIRSRLEEVQTERNFLRERLTRAEEEWAQKKEGPAVSLESVERTPVVSREAEEGHLLQQIQELREQLALLSKTEPLYRQLKGQFEEKNQVLHETRVLLFRSDTELQRLRKEAEEKALHWDPVPEALQHEMESVAIENQSLEEENRELQELVTCLMNESPVKKK
jgi:hypothetical protein